MNTMLAIRKLTAGLLMLVLGILALANIVYAFPTLEATVQTIITDPNSTIEEKIATLETTINDNFFGKYAFLEGYGLVQSALGKEEMNQFTIAKDNQDQLHYVYFQTEEAEIAPMGDAVVALAEAAEDSGAECFYLMPLSKQIEGYTTFDSGIPVPDENGTMDAFLDHISTQGVATLDLRDFVDDSGIDPQNLFYATDQHWTIDTAFWAFTQTLDYIEAEYDFVLDPDGMYTDLENYNQITYPASYLGSMGRTLGAAYSGIDDFNLIYPKFDTEFTIYAENYGAQTLYINNTHFQQALMNPYLFNTATDIMDLTSDKYFSYLWGDYGFTSVTNHYNPDGMKVLLVKDSLAVPLAAFLSSTCAQVDLIDPRWYGEDAEQYVAESNYDLVIVSVSSSNLTQDFFS